MSAYNALECWLMFWLPVMPAADPVPPLGVPASRAPRKFKRMGQREPFKYELEGMAQLTRLYAMAGKNAPRLPRELGMGIFGIELK